MVRSGWLGLLSVVAIAGCSSTGGGGSGGSGAPPLLTASFGPIDVPAGVETTQCIVVPLGNTEDVVLDGYDIDLQPGSHHLIVYMTSDAEQDDPVNCSPFTGLALGTDMPMVFANELKTSWSFPAGVAMAIPANQMIKIEAHYINTTASDIQGQGNVTFHTTPAASAPPYQPAGFDFFGTSDITIPPNASFSTGPQFQAGLPGTHLVSITTHQHRLGTGVQVWASTAEGDTSNQIANDKDWSTPSWSLLDPQFDFDGTSGLTYQCDWTNTTDQEVDFGESATNEMCFVGGYYYPSQGLYLCVKGVGHGCMTRTQ